MKHLFNNISKEDKKRILEQHSGGIKIDTSKFRKLVETKLGDAKPIISEEVTNSIIKIHKNFGGTPDENFFMLAQKVNGNNGFIYNCTDKVMRVGDGPETYKAEDFGLDPVETQTKIDGVCKSQVAKK